MIYVALNPKFIRKEDYLIYLLNEIDEKQIKFLLIEKRLSQLRNVQNDIFFICLRFEHLNCKRSSIITMRMFNDS